MSLLTMLGAEGLDINEGFAGADNFEAPFEDASLLAADAEIRDLEHEFQRADNATAQAIDGYTMLADLNDNLQADGSLDSTAARYAALAVTSVVGQDMPADQHPLTVDQYSQLASTDGAARKIGAVMRRVWEAIKQAVRKAIEFVKDLWRKYFSASKKMNDNLVDAKKRLDRIEDADAAKNAKGEMSVSDNALKLFTVDGKGNKADFTQSKVSSALSTFSAAVTKEFNDIESTVVLNRKIADACEGLSKDGSLAKTENIIKSELEKQRKAVTSNASFKGLEDKAGSSGQTDPIISGKGKRASVRERTLAKDIEVRYTTVRLTDVTVNARETMKSDKGTDVDRWEKKDVKSFIDQLIDLNKEVYSKDKAVSTLANERAKAIQQLDKAVARFDSAEVDDKDEMDSSKAIRELLNVFRDMSGAIIVDMTKHAWSLVREGLVLVNKMISSLRKEPKSGNNSGGNQNQGGKKGNNP